MTTSSSWFFLILISKDHKNDPVIDISSIFVLPAEHLLPQLAGPWRGNTNLLFRRSMSCACIRWASAKILYCSQDKHFLFGSLVMQMICQFLRSLTLLQCTHPIRHLYRTTPAYVYSLRSCVLHKVSVVRAAAYRCLRYYIDTPSKVEIFFKYRLDWCLAR